MRDYWLNKLFFDIQQPAVAAEYKKDRDAVLARYPMSAELRRAVIEDDIAKIAQFLQDNWVRATPDQKIWGVSVDYIIGSAFGAQIPVICKGDWQQFGTGTSGNYGSLAFGVDMGNVQYAPLRDTVFKDMRQARDADEQDSEFITECSIKIERPEVGEKVGGGFGEVVSTVDPGTDGVDVRSRLLQPDVDPATCRGGPVRAHGPHRRKRAQADRATGKDNGRIGYVARRNSGCPVE
jgi:hypothetical protein